MDARTSRLSLVLLNPRMAAWSMPDEMLEWLVRIHAHNSKLPARSQQRIGERKLVVAIRERYGVGVSTHTVAKWFASNREVLDELATHLG